MREKTFVYDGAFLFVTVISIMLNNQNLMNPLPEVSGSVVAI